MSFACFVLIFCSYARCSRQKSSVLRAVPPRLDIANLRPSSGASLVLERKDLSSAKGYHSKDLGEGL
eukprot:2660336-Amphidinium_carterae.1